MNSDRKTPDQIRAEKAEQWEKIRAKDKEYLEQLKKENEDLNKQNEDLKAKLRALELKAAKSKEQSAQETPRSGTKKGM